MFQDKLSEIIAKLKRAKDEEIQEPEAVKQIVDVIKTGKVFERIDSDISEFLLEIFLRKRGINVKIEKFYCRFLVLIQIGNSYTIVAYNNSTKGFIVKAYANKVIDLCHSMGEGLFKVLKEKYGEIMKSDFGYYGITVLTTETRSREEAIEDVKKKRWETDIVDIKGYLMKVNIKKGKHSALIFIGKEELEGLIEYIALMSLLK